MANSDDDYVEITYEEYINKVRCKSPPPKIRDTCEVSGCKNKCDLNIDPNCQYTYRSHYCKDHACVNSHVWGNCSEYMYDAPRREPRVDICKNCIRDLRQSRVYKKRAHARDAINHVYEELILEDFATLFDTTELALYDTSELAHIN